MKFLRLFIIGLLGAALLGTIVAIGVVIKFSSGLPTLDAIKNYTPLLITQVYSDNDQLLSEFSVERRVPIPVDQMPQNLVKAFVAAEDNEFFTHRGVNPFTIMRAAIKNMQAGQTVQGGSTITQQVAKSILLTPERSIQRKIKEMLLAFRIEDELSKDEILNLYFNHIFLGQGAYGVEAAAQTYFGKAAKDLTIPEAAILAGLPRAPSRDNPISNPSAAKQRQLYVLGRLLSDQVISQSEYEEFIKTPLKIKNKSSAEHISSPAPYFTEHVRRYLMQKYGADMVYGGGLKVYTTVNVTNQIAAQDSIKAGLIALDKRMGLRAPSKKLPTENDRKKFLENQHKELLEKHNEFKELTADGALEIVKDESGATPIEVGKNYAGVVVDKDKKATKYIVVQIGNRRGFIKPDDYEWPKFANPEEVYKEKVVRDPYKELKIGDVITVQPKVINSQGFDEHSLEQEPQVQGAILSYRIPDGAIVSMVGGYDYNVTKSEFNRAVQAVRQPGSTFKPILYAAALDAGLTPSTIIVDSPIIYRDADEQTQLENVWRPDNYDRKFYGDMTLRSALNLSRNIPAIKLLQHLKISTVIEYAKKLGIQSKLAEDLSIALGSSGMTLEELLKAWGVFANQGQRLTPYFIRKVVDRDGNVLEEYKAPEVEQVIPNSTAYLMTSLLKTVVEHGTGTPVKALGRPTAGKTGTTSDYKDALFVGYVPELITGVWVGFDEDRPIGKNELGGKAAAPIWLQYMQVATASLEAKDWEVPSTVQIAQIDSETGDVPTPRTQKRISEYFAVGNTPGLPKGTLNEKFELVVEKDAAPVKTAVVTGNPDVLPGSSQQNSEESDVNTDDLLREDY
jgi:penicillin-binding protein 1A